MGKVFTITEGLENLGALKTGGQGSVYKGKRTGEILLAVKILPTPIVSEDPNNKQYSDFLSEVAKLQRVNEEPNPHVVKILGAGITDTGCFPFIEMEFIEGPDLGELVRPPHEPIFTIRETLRVAEHLSSALAHCHRVEVKHGDIKSNNVKFNRHTGNYVLLDFGLAIMSDEQRRTSLRHAGAIEFMAPEQNEGRMLFQTDVYSFGVVIFELLTGQVPFPLEGNSETARNHVMLAHMEKPVPDLLLLRKNRLPEDWPEEKKEFEMGLPSWLISLVYKCLEKRPENRFANGHELHDYICLNSALSIKQTRPGAEGAAMLQSSNFQLLKEKDQLQQELLRQQKALEEKEKEIEELRTSLYNSASAKNKPAVVSRPAFFSLLALTLVFATLATYAMFFRDRQETVYPGATLPVDSTAYYDSVAMAEAEHAAKTTVVKKQKSSEQRAADSGLAAEPIVDDLPEIPVESPDTAKTKEREKQDTLLPEVKHR